MTPNCPTARAVLEDTPLIAGLSWGCCGANDRGRRVVLPSTAQKKASRFEVQNRSSHMFYYRRIKKNCTNLKLGCGFFSKQIVEQSIDARLEEFNADFHGSPHRTGRNG